MLQFLTSNLVLGSVPFVRMFKLLTFELSRSSALHFVRDDISLCFHIFVAVAESCDLCAAVVGDEIFLKFYYNLKSLESRQMIKSNDGLVVFMIIFTVIAYS